MSQQSSATGLSKTYAVANDPVISNFLRSPSPITKARAIATLQQFAPSQDPNTLQVELWDAHHSLVLTIPEGSSPVPANLETEFKQCATDPFKAPGALRLVNNNAVTAPGVAGVRDGGKDPIGYLVRWRKIGLNPGPQGLRELLGNQATLYFGNIEGDVWTDLTKVVPKPPVVFGSTSRVTQYSRDGNSVMALGRPIDSTPWAVVIEISDEVFVNQADRFLRRLGLISLGLLAIGVAGAFVLSQSIARPLRSLTAAASAISNGDYSRTVNIRQGGELGALAGAFNAMVATTRESRRELERKVQERTLQLEAAPCAMLMANSEGLITLVNKQAELLFGWEREELMGQPVEMLLPERFRASHPGHRKIFSQRPSARAMGLGRDLYGLRKDRSEVPIEIGLNPIETDNGTFVLASIIDITERKRAEERFRLVVDAAPSAMLMAKSDGLITLVNKQAEQLFGYSRAELLGNAVEMLVPERYRSRHPGHRELFSNHPTMREMGAGRDLYGLRKDGSEVPIEIGLNPIEMQEGAFVLASIIDITERKRSEQALRESEERLKRIVENLSEGLVISDLDGQLLHWNRTGLKMHGFSSMEECLLKVPEFERIFELSTLDGSPLSVEEWPLPRIIAGESLADLEICVRRIDVDWERIFSYGGGIVKEPSGRLLAYVTITDITASKHAEEKWRRSQAQLSSIIDSAMDAVITVDDDQRIVLFNGAAERMFLFPAEDAIGEKLDRFIPERFRAAHGNHIQDFGNTHVTRRSMGSLGALFGLRADGDKFPIEASISQIDSEGSKLFTVILRDITERKRADEAIREQARMLDLAPILILDLNGRIIFWNSGAEQMYGWKKEEALDKFTHALLKTEYPRPLEEIKARLLARGHWEGELVHTRKNGERIIVASHWVLHRDEQGKPKAILKVTNDVTEQKEAEKEIRRLNEELEQRVADRTAQLQTVNKELEAFSYSVSHDLRAPLRHINGFSQALLEDYSDKLDEAGKGYLQEVRSASQEMAQLIDDVLQLARVSRGEMHSEVVNLSDLARSVTAELKRSDADRTVTVSIQEGMLARGDKRLLRIVLTNLLGNAWKFTSQQEHAEIAFGGAQENGESFYFVRDNGAGFDMTYVNKLFGAFQRLHTAGEFEGTGIGLATVQRIINRHGGRVWAEGTVNEGASFYFTLPIFREIGDEKQIDPTG